MKKLENKVAIVTGGTSGLGEATAKLFAKEGAKVVVCGLKDDKAEAVVNDIKNDGGEVTFIELDVTSHDSVKNLVKEVVEKYGTIDILYNGAGIHDAYQDAVETEEDLYDKVIAVNVKGPYLLAKEILPIFKEKESGNIINIGSQSSFVAGAGGISYVTSKHAILGFTKQIAYDFGKFGIRSNLIAPGFMETPMTEGISDERLKDIPAGKPGKAEDIAKAALYLASDDSNYVQGAEIKVDGGWTVGR